MGKTAVARQESAETDVDEEIATLVDQLGELSAGLAAAKKTVKDYDAIRKQLVAIAEVGVAPEDETTVHGNLYSAKLGAAAEKREIIDKLAIFEAIGNDNFVALASFSLTDLDKYLNPDQIAKAVKKERVGARKTTVTKKS